MPSYLVVVNPVSGRGLGRERARALQGMLAPSNPVEVVETTARGSATEIAATRGGGVDRVVAVGGDGTLNEVLVGVLRTGASAAERPALGFLPSGTANAAVLAFGFATDPAVLARALPGATERPVDVGIARVEGRERPFLLWLGAGFDAVIIDALNRERTGLMGVRGLLRGAPGILGDILRYPAPDIRVGTPDGTRLTASSVILANVGKMAFGGAIADTADPFDGRVDLVALSPGSPWRLAPLAARMLASSLHRGAGIHHALVSGVELDSEGTVPVQLDGEPVGTLPVSVRMEPGAVRLLATGVRAGRRRAGS